MNDIGTLILIAVIVVAVILLIKRLMAQQSPFSQRGNEYSHTNDPSVSSGGSFGGSNQQGQRQNDDPNIGSHGSFGSSGSKMSESRNRDANATARGQSAVSEKSAERTRQNDDQNVDSHGGFGAPR